MKFYYGLLLSICMVTQSARFKKENDLTVPLKKVFCESYNCSLGKYLQKSKRFTTFIRCNTCNVKYSSMGTIATHLEEHFTSIAVPCLYCYQSIEGGAKAWQLHQYMAHINFNSVKNENKKQKIQNFLEQEIIKTLTHMQLNSVAYALIQLHSQT